MSEETKENKVRQEKLKALQLTLDKIEKGYGKGTIMKMGDSAVENVSAIPSGSISLDMALGVGGYPRGRVIEIYGPESSGKTTLAIHAIAEAQKAGGIAAFIDAEHAFDRFYAEKLGVDIENLYISQPDDGEQALEITDHLIRSGAVEHASSEDGVAVLDAALDHARAADSEDLLEWSLEQLVAVDDSRIAAWIELGGIRQRRDGSGRAVLEELLERRPRDPQAHVAFAQYLLALREEDAAVAHLERAAAEGIDPPVILGRLVGVQYALGRTEDAARTTERLQSEYPGHPVAERARAQQLIAEGRYAEAAERLRADIAREQSAAAQHLLAVAELGAGNMDSAVEAVERALALAPTARLYALRAHIRSDAGDCSGSLSDFERAVRGGQLLDQSEQLKVAWCFYETGQEDQGREHLERMMAGSNPYLPAVIAYASQEGKRAPQRALEWLTRVIATGRAEPRIRIARAELLAKMGRLEEAKAEAEAVFAEAPQETGALHVLAAVNAARGEIDPSIAALEKREREGHLTPMEAYFLAVLYDGKGDAERARAAYERAVALDGAVPQAKNNLAYLLAEEGDELDRALRLAREAAGELPEAPELLDTLGYVYYRMGRDRDAAEQFRRAIEAAPDGDLTSAYYHYHLGLVRKRMGREKIATRSFERALAIDPDFPDADRARALAQGGR